MRLKLRFDSLKQTKPTEYVSRFVFGGLVTVLAGLVANRFGPVIGGLFLAFPEIFPAGVSLVEKHKTLREKAEGKVGTWAARGQASVEATGASIGTLALMGFAWCYGKGCKGLISCQCCLLPQGRGSVSWLFWWMRERM
jgi:hypothetical protein